ncbi:MAG: glycosyltransferase family 2 protein [Blautia sp.]|nr:glycosyltransferase family 2 protein [Blautia sp.]
MAQKKASGGKIEWGRLIGRLSPYTVKKGLLYLKHYGPKEFFIRLQERFEPEEVPYDKWYPAYRPDEAALKRQRRTKIKNGVKISIAVPAYRTPEKFLRQMIGSILSQTYPEWELCIANGSPDDEVMAHVLKEYTSKDSRIRVKELKENLGIAGNSNAALAMAEGEFTGLLDHDDILAPNALFEIARAIAADPECDVVYTDEDKVTTDLSEHFQPHLKPDFNPDLLRSNNYICHFFLARTSLIREVKGFRESFDGAQDYDLILRCTEKARHIIHVPEILYHWRTHRASTADNPASKMYAYEAGRRAISEHLDRCGLSGTVSHTPDYGFYRVKYDVKGTPLVSIIIPNKDEPETLKNCIQSVVSKTTYANYEILIVENNSTGREIFDYYRELSKKPGIRLFRYRKPFNYSEINNFGEAHARGEYLVFLNNDIEVITPGWIEEMLGVCQREDTGAVGVKLLYPDNTIQHAGIVIGIGGIAGNMFVNMPGNRSGYLHKASIMQDMSAVTAACMMVKKSVFDGIGGFEEKLAVAFNDVDLCLRIRQSGYLVVYDPYVQMYHLESKTRGAEDNEQKVRRFQSEIELFRTRWIDMLKKGDPLYNKNLSLTKWNYSLKAIEGMEEDTEDA